MVNNIYQEIPKHLPTELIKVLAHSESATIERIISKGHTSPENFWYDQDKNEWVIVLKGRARLTFADRKVPVTMKSGDYIIIPAHCRHRVEWTDPDETTIWLAVHY